MSEQEHSEFTEESGPLGSEVLVETGEEEPLRAALPDALPILPLKNTVLFPHLLSPLLVNTERSRALIESVLRTPDRLLVCAAVHDGVDADPAPEELHCVGTVMRIAKMLKFPDDSYRLLVQGVARARIGPYVSADPFMVARVERLQETGDMDSVETAALVRNILQDWGELVSNSSKLSDDLTALAHNVDTPSKLADLVGSNLDLGIEGKQALLEELDVPARLLRVHGEMGREQDAMKVETEIREKVQSDIGKTQRDYMLRQQLEAIRQELGEGDDTESETEQLRERIEAAGMPEEAHDQALRELDRLAQMPTAAAEHGVIRSYLEWMADLPWSEQSEDRLHVEEARRILDEDHYGLEKVKDRIVEYIAVLSLKRDLKGPILCFVGPPGTGKTSLGRSIARALGREFHRISLGGVRDEAEIRGHRRTYIGALPGKILQSLSKAGSGNPIFLLDEVDKMSMDFRGDPSSALLEVLDPEQNHTFNDHYLDLDYDLSRIMFVVIRRQIPFF